MLRRFVYSKKYGVNKYLSMDKLVLITFLHGTKRVRIDLPNCKTY